MKKLNRRTFLMSAAMAGGATLVVACAPAATPEATTAPAMPAATATTAAAMPEATATTAAAAPAAPDMGFAVAPEAVNPLKVAAGDVDGVFFAGGFGDDYIKYAGKLQEKLHPGTTVKIQSIQKITEQLQPRFVAGNPPDVIDNSGANMIPMADLVANGQLMDLTPLLNAPALDTPGKKFSETLYPGSQDSAVFDGKPVGVNIAYTISGIWYSKPAFEKAGYKYPTTWADMLTLCEQIKKDGKAAPWTYQGKYPYYIWGIVLNMLMYYAGGNDLLMKIDNLEPNAWSDPAVARAVTDLYQLWDKGYILKGTAGLTHTESQTEWLKGNATFIPCGNWLENEMKTVTPADFSMVVAPVPGYADGKGDQKAVNANGGETYVVPAKAKNPQQGMEYLRVLLSKNSAKFFAENVRAVMPVYGGTEGANLSPAVQSAVAMADAAKGVTVLWNLPNWYSSFSKDLETKTGELMTGVAKPADFIAAMQKSADAVAKDPDIKKFKRTK
jgi:N-acetylglucosamine transport system substrate-binding protein